MWRERRWWRWVTLCVCLSGPALGAPEEVEPGTDTEEALRAAWEEGLLTEEAYEELLELHARGVNLETASRESLYALPGLTWAQVDAVLAHRRRAGGVRSPEALVDAGLLSREQLQRLRPFLSTGPRQPQGPSGRLRLLATQGLEETGAPPLLLQARLEAPGGWSAGTVATLTRRRLGEVHYMEAQRTLVADLPGPALHLPRFYVQWSGERATLLAGTYRLGFGQRLVLDTTGRQAPQGPVVDDSFTPPGPPERGCLLSPSAPACKAAPERATGDYGWREGLRGLAGSLHLPVEGATLALTGFASWQPRGVLQAELEDPQHQAPTLLLAGGNGARFTGRTVPEALHELAAGGNATLRLSERTRVGWTGWGAWPLWRLPLELKPQARLPPGGPFGATGVELAWGAGPVDVALEAAHSFDQQGGGLGAVQRTVLSARHQELELVLRYYSRGFDNPYSRAPSAADEHEGLRARNEVGARARYLLRLPQALAVRGEVDVWAPPEEGKEPAGTTHLQASTRLELLALPGLRPSVWAEHRLGELSRLGAGLRLGSAEVLQLGALYQQGWRTGDKGIQEEARASLELLAQPWQPLRLQARLSWLDEDLASPTRPQSLRAWAEAAYAPAEWLALRARYELLLDTRDASGDRSPPEPPWHSLRLELETRF